MSLKLYLTAGAALAIVTVLGLGYWHYTGLVSDLEISKAIRAKLELTVEVQTGTIAAAQGNAADWQYAYGMLEYQAEVVRQIAAEAQREQERLDAIFAKHDLGALAGAKPALLERRLNAGTVRIGRLLECASGAEGADCPD